MSHAEILAVNSMNPELSKKEHDDKQEFNRSYNEIRDAILNNKKGYALGAAREKFESLNVGDAEKVLEMFYSEEGALPGELGKEYIKLVYSPASLLEKMESGKTFYEAVAVISLEVKNKHIELDPDAINTQIKESSTEIFKQTEDAEAKEA